MTRSQIVKQGLWSNNPALVQLLGLCPLLAVSNTVATSLGLGLATIAVLGASNCLVALIRNQVDEATRLPLFILIIAGLVTCVDLAMQAWSFELHQRISLFVALIVTNCVLLGRAETFASNNPVFYSLLDGLMMGTGFLLVLLAMGFCRELLGYGTLFSQMDLLFGDTAKTWTIHFTTARQGFLLAVLPPGAFIMMGLFLALKNLVDERFFASPGIPDDGVPDDGTRDIQRVRIDMRNP
jgi:electron transport complex protein RnfE